MKNKNNLIGRRQFLQGLGGFTLSLPYLTSLMSKEAVSAVMGGADGIFIQLLSPNAFSDQAWFPQVQPNQWQVLSDYAKTTNLSNFAATGISRVFDATYASQYKHYTLIKGLGIHGPKPGHQAGALCMGSHHGISFPLDPGWVHNSTLDKVLENSPKFYSSNSAVIKNLSVSTSQTHGPSFTADGTQSPCFSDPRVVFDLFFGSTVSQSSGHQINVLNSVTEDYTRLKNSPRISYGDKMLLEERMDMFADLQSALNNVQANQCVPPPQPNSFPGFTTSTGIVNTDAHTDALLQVCLAAIKCNLTRILIWNELAPMGLSHFLHHDSSHGGPWDVQIEYQQWIHKKIFSKLVAGLDVQDGSGKTYLERTGLVHMLENGGDGVLHNLNDAYVICAGGMNGYLDPGKFYDYNWTNPNYGDVINLPLNCLWNSILESNGLVNSDYKRAGQQGGGFGYSLVNSDYQGNAYFGRGKYQADRAGQLLPFMKRAA